MEQTNKQRLVGILLLAIIAAGISGWLLWSRADEDAVAANSQEELVAAMVGRDPHFTDADHTASVVLFALGGLSMLAVVLVGRASESEVSPASAKS